VSSFSPVEIILASLVAIAYLAYWWAVVKPGQARLRAWVEARHGKDAPNGRIQLLRMGYFMSAFAVFAGAFYVTALIFRRLAR
jgi:hypothetical protein